jgi:hypothetical protein
VFHAIRFARVSEAAYSLGLKALADKSYMVRYRACMVLAYSLRTDAIPALTLLLHHADARTREDAAHALRRHSAPESPLLRRHKPHRTKLLGGE